VDVDAYLHRIGARRPAEPDAAGLAELHAAHLRTVPFENLDIYRGVPISLELRDVFDKIVRRHRGGYCYESNGLFAWVLGELGYRVSLLSARVVESDGRPGADFEHLRLSVEASGRLWLADVGNGSGLTDPVPHRPGTYRVGGRRCVVVRSGLWWRTELEHGNGELRFDWTWTTTPRRLADFTERHLYQQRSPESHFVQHRMCVLLTDHGRVTLIDGVLSERIAGHHTQRRLSAAEEAVALRERFGLNVDLDIEPHLLG
jgi:N-hydroxyarylamine O-acetyltransferase